MERKTLPSIVIKIEADQGIVEHTVAVMGNVDLGGDRIHNGSFTKTINERMGKIRVLDSHRTDSIMDVLGKPLRMWEIGKAELPAQILAQHPDATGALMARTQFLMSTPEGRGAFERIKSRAVGEYSIGYDPMDVDFSDETIDGKEINVRNLRTIKLYEYSPVLFGMNPATTTISAKDKKPAPEVTENTIRIRVRDPGDFQQDSFRTITIGAEDDGIQAVVGRLTGEETTTTQAFIFDKEKWTVGRAQAWVDEHKEETIDVQKGREKGARLFIEVGRNEEVMHALHEQRWDMERALFESVVSIMADETVDSNSKLTMIGQSLDQFSQAMIEWSGRAIAAELFADDKGWQDFESKIGRAISAARGKKIQGAIDNIQAAIANLEEMLAAAGVTAAVETEEDMEKSAPVGQAAHKDQDRTDTQAGPDGSSPTSKDAMLAIMDVMETELQLLEV